MRGIAESIGSIGIGILFMLGNFPGGTVTMALSCNARRLDGWDWVLSVIIPFYGLIKAIAC
jgi:hypothetical protein